MGIIDAIGSIWKEKKVIEGKATKNKLYSSKRTFNTEEEAKEAYQEAVKKLLDVNRWSDMPGITSGFQLYDPEGTTKYAKEPELYDYLKIDLPGPLPMNWVQVIDIHLEEDSAEFTVTPSQNPREKQDRVRHFFSDAATSTFRVALRDKTLYAYEIGKREGINNQEGAGGREMINTLTAEAGWAGIQHYQWNKLTDYLVHKIEINE